MHELPKDLTNSLRSFRGSIYGRGQPQEGQSARVEDEDLEKGPEDYRDTEFDRALNTSQSSIDMVRQVLEVATVHYHHTDLHAVAISYVRTRYGPSTARAAG
jgi:hypothetical protein